MMDYGELKANPLPSLPSLGVSKQNCLGRGVGEIEDCLCQGVTTICLALIYILNSHYYMAW